jgi:hypothetical protein
MYASSVIPCNKQENKRIEGNQAYTLPFPLVLGSIKVVFERDQRLLSEIKDCYPFTLHGVGE